MKSQKLFPLKKKTAENLSKVSILLNSNNVETFNFCLFAALIKPMSTYMLNTYGMAIVFHWHSYLKHVLNTIPHKYAS